MSKEKKLSKDELDAIEVYEKILRSPDSPARRRNILGGLLKKHKRLIESSAQEPMKINQDCIANIQCPHCREKIKISYLKTFFSQEPSEAEVEKFIEKEAKVWGHFSPRQKEIVKDFLWEVIKEYDKLRRGK